MCLIEFRSKNIYTCRIHSMYMRTKEFFCAKGYFVIFSTRFFFSFFNFLCKYTRHILYKHEYNVSRSSSDIYIIATRTHNNQN